MKAAKLVEACTTSLEERELIWAIVESAGWRTVLGILNEHVLNYGTERDQTELYAELTALTEAWGRQEKIKATATGVRDVEPRDPGQEVEEQRGSAQRRLEQDMKDSGRW